jgi:multimeric flavodoxin WrbA
MGSEHDILIVYHSQSGNTERLSAAVEEGALRVQGVGVRRARAVHVGSRDLTACRCLVICSPEYFGYMAGAIKDLFDRTYEELQNRMVGLAYTIVISAGNDGTGALSSIERIVRGYKLRRIQEPIISRGEVSRAIIEKCLGLGQTLAAGVDLGIY